MRSHNPMIINVHITIIVELLATTIYIILGISNFCSVCNVYVLCHEEFKQRNSTGRSRLVQSKTHEL